MLLIGYYSNVKKLNERVESKKIGFCKNQSFTKFLTAVNSLLMRIENFVIMQSFAKKYFLDRTHETMTQNR